MPPSPLTTGDDHTDTRSLTEAQGEVGPPAAKPEDPPASVGTTIPSVDGKQSGDLIQASIRGTPWLMISILVGVPLGLLTQVMIGRVLGKEGLGYYTLMLLLVTLVQTFFLFGGSNVIVNFIPRATPPERSAFLLSYLGIALGFAAGFFALLLIFPAIIELILLRSEIRGAPLFGFLALFIPIVIGQTVIIALLQSEMQIGAAARAQYGVQVAACLLTLPMIFVIVPRHLLHPLPAVATIVGGAYALSCLNGGVTLWRVMRRGWQWCWQWQLPANFWRFTTTFHIHTIITFFFTSADQIFILAFYHGVGNVGIFRAAIVVTTYAFWAPNLFTGAMYPLFTNLVACHDFKTLAAAYQRFSALTAIIVALVSLAAGLFAPEIMQLFGKDFGGDGVTLMLVFALIYTLLASLAYVPAAALITAHEDVWINLVMNALALAVRLVLFVPLVQRYHLLGVAFADGISLGFLQGGTLLIVGIRYKVQLAYRQYLVSLAGGLLLLGAYRWAPVPPFLHLAKSIVLLALFGIFLCWLQLIRWAEIKQIVLRLVGDRRGRWFGWLSSKFTR